MVLPGVEEGPSLHLGKVVGEEEEAEHVGYQNGRGMALE
jgi:hypothetical protein